MKDWDTEPLFPLSSSDGVNKEYVISISLIFLNSHVSLNLLCVHASSFRYTMKKSHAEMPDYAPHLLSMLYIYIKFSILCL